jgi:hypothetical protein
MHFDDRAATVAATVAAAVAATDPTATTAACISMVLLLRHDDATEDTDNGMYATMQTKTVTLIPPMLIPQRPHAHTQSQDAP